MFSTTHLPQARHHTSTHIYLKRGTILVHTFTSSAAFASTLCAVHREARAPSPNPPAASVGLPTVNRPDQKHISAVIGSSVQGLIDSSLKGLIDSALHGLIDSSLKGLVDPLLQGLVDKCHLRTYMYMLTFSRTIHTHPHACAHKHTHIRSQPTHLVRRCPRSR